MEEWIQIPGFPHYQVCTTRPGFRSDYKGEWKELSCKDGEAQLYIENGKGYIAIRWARAVYSARRGIDPRILSKAKVNVYIDDDGEIEMLTKEEMARRMLERREKNRKEQMEDGHAEKKYREIVEFAGIVLDFMHTGNGSQITEYLYSKKANILSYLRMKFRIKREYGEEVANIAIEETLRVIQERRTIITLPTFYMQKTAVGIVQQELKYRVAQNDDGFMERIMNRRKYV